MRSYTKKGQVEAFLIEVVECGSDVGNWAIRGKRDIRRVSLEFVSEHRVSPGDYYIEEGSKRFCMSHQAFERIYEPAFATGGIARKPVIAPGVAIDTKEIIMPIITRGVLKTSVCEMCACKDDTIAALRVAIDALRILRAEGLPEDVIDCEAMSK